MIQTKSEDAVSPVIGVMLMLVVTIVIAAVVAVFASGVGMDAEPAPVTVVDISDISGGYTEMQEVYSVNDYFEMGTNCFSYLGDDGDIYYFKMDLSKYISGKPDDNMVEGVDYLGYYDVNIETWEEECISYYILDNGIEGLQSSTFAKRDSNGWSPTGSNTELQNEFLTTEMEEHDIGEKTVTLNCLHGDSLDLSKISIQVTYKDRHGEYVIKTPRNTYSGTLSAGDTKKLHLADDPYLWKIGKGSEVDITIFYGDYVLVTEDKMTVSWDYR